MKRPPSLKSPEASQVIREQIRERVYGSTENTPYDKELRREASLIAEARRDAGEPLTYAEQDEIEQALIRRSKGF